MILHIYRHLYLHHQRQNGTAHILLFSTWGFLESFHFRALFSIWDSAFTAWVQKGERTLATRYNWEKNHQDVTWCHKLTTMFSAVWPCQLLNQQRKESQCHGKNTKCGVRTRESASNFYLLLHSWPWASRSTSYHLGSLPPPFNACPTVLREWSFEHWCSGDGQRGGGMSELKHILQKSLSLSTSLRSCLPLSSLWLPSGIRHSLSLPLSTHFQDCTYHTLIRLNMSVFAAQWQTPLE